MYANRSTGGTSTTGSTTGTLYVGDVLGSSSVDYPSPMALGRNIFDLDAATWSVKPAFATTFITNDRYYGIAAYLKHYCKIDKVDGVGTVNFSYTSPTAGYAGSLHLGSISGSDFLPEEIEMTADNTSSVYAFSGTTIYRIDNITANDPYATAVYSLPSGWTFYRKTLSPTCGASTELRLVVAKTGVLVGSSVSSLQTYTLDVSAPTVTPTLISSTALTYTNTQNLSSFTNFNNPSVYYIVIGDGTAGTGTIYNTSATSVASFPSYVNDCAFYIH